MHIYACSVSVENFFLYIVLLKTVDSFRSVIALKFFLYIGWRNRDAILGFT